MMFSLLLFLFCVACKDSTNPDNSEHTSATIETTPPPTTPEPEKPAPTKWIEHKIKKGESLGTILPKYKAPVYPVLEAAKPIYDLTKVRIGHSMRFLQLPEQEIPSEIRYPLGPDDTLVITRQENTWKAKKESIQYTQKRGYRSFTVERSFWKAARKAGLQGRDIAGIIQVFEYELDFNTEIRKGATAKMVVQEHYLDGKFVKLGAPEIVEFVNRKKKSIAIRFTNKFGLAGYFDEKGISKKGAFLRSPLAFSRVTSGFNPRRYHPILKRRRPHNGTDFGAPVGTPIRAVADGKVVKLRRSRRGHGNFIKLAHQSSIHTSYSHLSKIMVKRGQQVKQGQIIGKVGKSGLATGPHLHYQMWVKGRFVDAMRVKLPTSSQLFGKQRKQFQKVRTQLLQDLENYKNAETKTTEDD